MKKVLVLDTNVLLDNPRVIFSLTQSDIYIPITAIEELDKFKSDLNDAGRNARIFSRIIDSLRERGSLKEGVTISPHEGSSGKIYILTDFINSLLPKFLNDSKDNIILNAALSLKKSMPHKTIFLLSKDTNMRIKADALGLSVESVTQESPFQDYELYKGLTELTLSHAEFSALQTHHTHKIKDKSQFFPNQYVILKKSQNFEDIILGRYNHIINAIDMIPQRGHKNTWGILPRNLEQNFALDMLLDDSIKLATLVGTAGTGKTLLAIAAGLAKTTDDPVYKKLLVSRPIFPLGKDLGYLPGTLEEKLNPWLQPIFDNLEFLMSEGQPQERSFSNSYDELLNQGILEIEPLTYIRGRSIPNQFFIVDEAQNLTKHEIKTIITRAGENTKVILTGDPYQIDNPLVDSSSNGLSYVVEKFKNEPIAAHITLIKGERSPLANIAARIL